MQDMIVRSAGYLLLIILGYSLKKIGILKTDDKTVLGKTLMYIFLPAAFISNFAHFKGSLSLIGFFMLGLIFNILSILAGLLFSNRKDRKDRALYMIDCSGYNIGAFTSPVVGAMLPVQAIVMTSIFDIGNSILCTGGIYPFANNMAYGKSDGNAIIIFCRKMLSSVPFDTYLLMLLLSLLGIRLPKSINSIASMLGTPAIIITMIMIGIAFEINVKKEEIVDIIKIIAIRLLMSFAFTAIVWLLLPFPLLEKEVLTICIFAPVTSISPNFCMMCGCNPAVYGAVSSFTVPISLISFTILMSMFLH